MCQTINGRNLLVVGDSMSRQFYLALLFMVDITFPSFFEFPGNRWCILTGTCPDYSLEGPEYTIACPNPAHSFNASFASRVQLNDPMFPANGTYNETAWLHLITTLNISILILNRGAWYVQTDLLLSQLTATFDYITSMHPQVKIIWRDTPFGHKDYDKHFNSLPLQAPAPLTSNKWNGHDINRQGAEIRKLILRNFTKIVYMTVLPMTATRVDSHCDSLHYCLPSVVNEWVMAFYEVIHIMDNYRHENNSLALCPIS